MDRNSHKNDISIGPDKWISFGDLAVSQTRAVQVDSQLASVMPLIERLETECVSQCCGIHAFRLWPEEIEKAISTLGHAERDKLASDLASVQVGIEQLPCDTVVSTRINQYFRKPVFLEILTHIHNVVNGVYEKRAGPRRGV